MRKNHLELLRDEHLELQAKHTELQKKYQLLQARLGDLSSSDESSFVHQLLGSVARLYEKDLYSDITLLVSGRQLRAHRFLLSARSPAWADLSSTDRITIDDVPPTVFSILLKWMYTDSVDPKLSDDELLDLARAAGKYQLKSLRDRCESLIIARLNVNNCVGAYEVADREGFTRLREMAAGVVATHWNELGPEHFARLDASLLFRLLKSHLLHSIVQLAREDVLFLYFIEHDSELEKVTNSRNAEGETPLELALRHGHLGLADQLLSHKARSDEVDENGDTAMVKAIRRGDVASCRFLADHGASLAWKHSKSGRTLTHEAAESASRENSSEKVKAAQEEIAKWLGENFEKVQVNEKDSDGRTSLLVAVQNENLSLVETLLTARGINTNVASNDEKTPLEVAIFEKQNLDLASKLLVVGADVNLRKSNGWSLLHEAVRRGDDAPLFLLLQHGNSETPKLSNEQGLTLLHVAATEENLTAITKLLEAGAEATSRSKAGNTPLHIAAKKESPDILIEILKNAKDIDWSIRDANGQSVLGLALVSDSKKGTSILAKLVVDAGAAVDERDRQGRTLLVQSLSRADEQTAVFLLRNGASISEKETDGRTLLELAASEGLETVTRELAGKGVDLNEKGPAGWTALHAALVAEQWKTAALLVELGADVDSEGVSGTTLLADFIDRGQQEAAVFLIQRGCQVNSLHKGPAKPSDEGCTPTHAAVTWGLHEVVEALVAAGADLNVQDEDGRTPAHVAIRERNPAMVELLLKAKDVDWLSSKDKHGHTPLSLAIHLRDNRSAAAIVNRQPHAALQTNGQGENLLHQATKANDLESVLFLLGAHTDPTKTTLDQDRWTALHLSARVDEEMIMRNLILAGSLVNARSARGLTALHEAAAHGRSAQLLILLDNGADPNIVDVDGNNPLHTAIASSSVECVRVLLENSCVDHRAINKKGQTPLHICASVGNSVPTEMCELLLAKDALEASTEDFRAVYLDARDAYGNTALLLAYQAGAAGMCRSLLRRGACMGLRNAEGVSVFSHETPTRQLLFGLLESLEREPRWSDGETCSECEGRFSLTNRKHHCRHCGRLVCARCSETTIPILKFGEEKKVRVCNVCADVLTMGTSR